MLELLTFRVLLNREDGHAALPLIRGRGGYALVLEAVGGDELLRVPVRLVEHLEHEDPHSRRVLLALAAFAGGHGYR